MIMNMKSKNYSVPRMKSGYAGTFDMHCEFCRDVYGEDGCAVDYNPDYYKQ